MKISIFSIILVLFAGAAAAAGIDGKWEGSYVKSTNVAEWGEVRRINKTIKVSYDFKSKGNKLTGTALTPDGEKVKIKKGKIKGNIITFSVPVKISGAPFTYNYTGILSGNEIKMSYEVKGNLVFPNGVVGSFTSKISNENKSGETGMQATTVAIRRDRPVSKDGSQKNSNEFIVRRVE